MYQSLHQDTHKDTENEKCQKSELAELQIPEENIVRKMLLSQNKEQELQAKLIKLDQWKVREIYIEVDDQGQEFISLRWAMKLKVINNKPDFKARLCTRGFEEEH